MRTSDQTLLSKLGFNDPDKRSQEHDLICAYLTQTDALTRLFPNAAFEATEPATIQGPQQARYEGDAKYNGYVDWKTDWDKVNKVFTTDLPITVPRSCGTVKVRAATEVPITKGSGQYKTFIGFADVVAEWIWSFPPRTEHWINLLIEVKALPFNTADAVRQLKLYREYMGEVTTILVTPQKLSALDQKLLTNESIQLVQVGMAYRLWKDAQANKPAQELVEL